VLHQIVAYEVSTLAVDVWAVTVGTAMSLGPPRPILAVPNVTARPSMASVPTALLCPLLCGFNVPIKGSDSLNAAFQQDRNAPFCFFPIRDEIQLGVIVECGQCFHFLAVLKLALAKLTFVIAAK